MHAAPALSLSNRQIDELGACWNSVICRIFGYSRTESVKAVLLGLNRLNVKHIIIMQRKVKFFKHPWFSGNYVIRKTQCFYLFLLSSSNGDSMLNSFLDDKQCFYFLLTDI